MVVSSGARVMSLTDGTAKMSKSDPQEGSRINILDPPDEIVRKIKKCKTDAFVGIEAGNPERPEAENLLTIYKAVQPDRDESAIISEVEGMSWGDFKPLLSSALVEYLSPIQERYKEIRQDDDYLKGVLETGKDRAQERANETLKRAKIAMGFNVV